MVQTRQQQRLHLRNRYVDRAKHVSYQTPKRTVWNPPPYGEWPEQESGRPFVRFIQENYRRFKRAPQSNWTNSCDDSKSRQANGRFKLQPHQQFIASIVSPATKVKRIMVASSTGSGKTILVTSIICNFLDPTLYPTRRPKPTAIIVITQSSALKQQLYQTLQNDAPCVIRAPFKHMADQIQQGRLTAREHPYWWAEKWLAAHETPVHILTYGQAIRRPAALFQNAVVILDEAHTLVDTSALALSQRNAVLRMKRVLGRITPYVLVGLTGSPLGQSWEHFVDLHNIFANPRDRVTGEEFKLLFLDTVENVHTKALEKCGVKSLASDPAPAPAHNHLYIWNPKSLDSLTALGQKISPYLYFYDAAYDESRFAKTTHDQISVEPDGTFIKHALMTKEGKLRTTFGRTRLVATDNIHAGREAVLRSIETLDDLKVHSPVVYKLLDNLRSRKRKAVIYSDVQAAYGSEFVYGILKKFSHLVFARPHQSSHSPSSTHSSTSRRQPHPQPIPIPLFHLSSSQRVGEQARTISEFNKHKGVNASSAIIVLGPQFSTGIDLHGAASSMHILNILPNDALDKQVRGRVHRSCSHGSLQQDEWIINYYQYKLDFAHPETGVRACDLTIDEYRAASDSVMRALSTILRNSSLGCPNMAAHHKHPVEDCVTP